MVTSLVVPILVVPNLVAEAAVRSEVVSTGTTVHPDFARPSGKSKINFGDAQWHICNVPGWRAGVQGLNPSPTLSPNEFKSWVCRRYPRSRLKEHPDKLSVGGVERIERSVVLVRFL